MIKLKKKNQNLKGFDKAQGKNNELQLKYDHRKT